MRYIGPFFRMNSLSENEITSQLFYLSKEALKTLVLNSKCGLVYSTRNIKKSSTNDISTLYNFSPLLCIYKKASPAFIHSKSSRGFDDSTFKKEINPGTNALMTLSLLELTKYYNYYDINHRSKSSFTNSFKALAKEQLEFYYNNLRNTEGIFVTKKNINNDRNKEASLVDKDKKFNLIDQALMMNAYYLFAMYNPDNDSAKDYKGFSLEILQVFLDFKESLYNLGFNDSCKLLLSLNTFYSYSKNDSSLELIIDLSDYLINLFDERDFYIDSIDSCALLAICLKDSYIHSGIIAFDEKHKEIMEKLLSLYDNDKGIFIKDSNKKDVKYSSPELILYLLSLITYSKSTDRNLQPIISNYYKKSIVNSGIITSWPEAPTLDHIERYRTLSLRSEDMIDETFFKMANSPTPEGTGIAPILLKSVNYSRKKDSFSNEKLSFDSSKNLFLFYITIYYFMDDMIDFTFKDNIKSIPSPLIEGESTTENLHKRISSDEILKDEGIERSNIEDILMANVDKTSLNDVIKNIDAPEEASTKVSTAEININSQNINLSTSLPTSDKDRNENDDSTELIHS